MKRIVLSILLVILGLCAISAKDETRLRLATTTSTDDSGLLEYLLPDFENRHKIKVDVIAVGTGKALKLAENGDVDVILVHAPAAEKVFVDNGFGVNRRSVMKNDFIIAGPAKDPADLGQAVNVAGALSAVKAKKSVFISRGDDSGTHKKEKSLWSLVSGPPESGLLLETGQGMSSSLRVASEKQAYVLCDRGTWLAVRDTLDLTLVYEGGPELDNPYSVIAVNPARYADIDYIESMLFIGWLTSPGTQKKIAGFEKHGQVLFHPTAVP